MKVRNSFWIVLAILLGSILAYIWSKSIIFLRITLLCSLLIGVSWLWASFSTKGFSLVRKARIKRLELGQIFEEHFQLNNEKRLIHPWVEIVDETTLPFSGGSKVLSWIGAKERRSYSAYTLLAKRGEYLLGPTAIRSGDPFGIFSNVHYFGGKDYLFVMPYHVEIERFPYPPGLLAGGKTQRQKTMEITPHAAGIREYAPGDTFNRIHWPTSARRDKLMVKEFEQDPQSDIWIMVDASRNIHIHREWELQPGRVDHLWLWKHKKEITIPPDTFEYAVSIAASIARFFTKKGLKVGFGSAGQRMVYIPPERGERQLVKIMEILALLEDKGKLPLAAYVESQVQNISRGATVILISTTLETSVLLAVEELLRRNLRPVVVLTDTASFIDGEDEEDNIVKDLVDDLAIRKVPVTVISRDDSIVDALENGFIQRSYL
jgi:uncharacterized protein (DUF58 family)